MTTTRGGLKGGGAEPQPGYNVLLLLILVYILYYVNAWEHQPNYTEGIHELGSAQLVLVKCNKPITKKRYWSEHAEETILQ